MNYNISFVTSRYLATGDAIMTIAYNFQTGYFGCMYHNLRCLCTNIHACTIGR